MDELFHVSERKSTIGTELRAGLTTFLAMAYIIAVNPAVLSGAGIDAGALACATCLGAGIMTICMGIFANRPLACASGLGVNAMIAGVTTTVCGGDWHVAMSVIFLEGIVILLLVLCGLREAIMDAIPVVLRHAISVGLGLFIAMIGLCDAGIITAGAGTLVGLGDITSPTFIVGIISILVTVALACRNVPGSLLIGIVVGRHRRYPPRCDPGSDRYHRPARLLEHWWPHRRRRRRARHRQGPYRPRAPRHLVLAAHE